VQERPPVSIITGYLGSGKTTLLNRLLRDPGMARAAVIINEFGAVALDHLLVATPNENTVLLANGCLCCTIRGDLVGTLAGLLAKRGAGGIPAFDRVLVETTGLADPVPVLRTLASDETIAPRLRPGAVITMVDGVNGEGRLDDCPESVKQAAVADCLLISKTDIAEAAALGFDRFAGPRVHRLEELDDHIPVFVLGPTPDHAAVRPHARPGVAVAVEEFGAVLAQVPRAVLPPHDRRVEPGQQRHPGTDLRDRLAVIGQHVARALVERDLDAADRLEGLRRQPGGPPRPPPDVRRRRGPERPEPSAQQVGASLGVI